MLLNHSIRRIGKISIKAGQTIYLVVKLSQIVGQEAIQGVGREGE